MHELMPSFLPFPFIVVRLTVTYRGLRASEYLFPLLSSATLKPSAELKLFFFITLL